MAYTLHVHHGCLVLPTPGSIIAYDSIGSEIWEFVDARPEKRITVVDDGLAIEARCHCIIGVRKNANSLYRVDFTASDKCKPSIVMRKNGKHHIIFHKEMRYEDIVEKLKLARVAAGKVKKGAALLGEELDSLWTDKDGATADPSKYFYFK